MTISEIIEVLDEANCCYEIIEQDKPILSALDAEGFYPVEKAAPTYVWFVRQSLFGPGHSHGMDIYITIPSEEYRKVISDTRGALKYFINVKENQIDTAEKYISDYCDNISASLDYTSRETYLKDFNETIQTFLIIGGALSAILALIAILNMINLTYTFIHERKQELSVLGAIGMTKKQIAAMLSYEGIFRVLLTFALVLTVGQLLNYAIVYLMAGSMIMFSYRYVVWPMLACIPIFLIIAAYIPRVIWRNNIT